MSKKKKQHVCVQFRLDPMVPIRVSCIECQKPHVGATELAMQAWRRGKEDGIVEAQMRVRQSLGINI